MDEELEEKGEEDAIGGDHSGLVVMRQWVCGDP